MPRTSALSAPDALDNMPAPPADLPAAGRELWEHTLRLRPAATWTQADCVLLALYVRAVLDVQRLDRQIASDGEVTTSPNGMPMVHPLVQVRARREKTLLDAANRLRLAPSSRYTARRVAELSRHASKAARASAAIEADDLLAGKKH